jgi:hypothetical protein
VTYELAKQLKIAGFKDSNGWVWHDSETLPMPTLSELINACGEDFISLIHPPIVGAWEAYAQPVDDSIDSVGSTPEEAVAKLWLSLNKK